MFLKLHYKESGNPFMVNVNAIDGIEINGTMENGCVLTIAAVAGVDEGKRSFETVLETFEDLERRLWNSQLIASYS
jgi:hypothetical protein